MTSGARAGSRCWQCAHRRPARWRDRCGASRIAVEQGGRQAVGPEGGERGGIHVVLLAAGTVRRVHDDAGGDFGLMDRRHRLRVFGQSGAHPGELRSVDGGQSYHRRARPAVLVQGFGAHRRGEAVDGVLGAAVGGLQRDGPPSRGPARRCGPLGAEEAGRGPAAPALAPVMTTVCDIAEVLSRRDRPLLDCRRAGQHVRCRTACRMGRQPAPWRFPSARAGRFTGPRPRPAARAGADRPAASPAPWP